jgi:exosortase
MPRLPFRLPLPFWPTLGLLLGWGVLITQVRHHWGGESYYNFGWFVPVLAVWLLLRNIAPLSAHPAGGWRLSAVLWITGLAMALLLPFHALSEVNPFWRLPLWIQASGLVLLSLGCLYSVYGLKGIRAGIFPLFFLCTMIPWPYRVEMLIIQNLTDVVVSLSMSGLHAIGYPVELAGNSFVLGDLQIGVNEACSGIRSLQALFMITLFLGSLFGQGTLRRILAVLLLPLVVIVVNVMRAIFLSTQVIVNGQEAYDAWHDPAGYIAFLGSMILIYAIIELLNAGADAGRAKAPDPIAALREDWKAPPLPKRAALFVVFPLLLALMVEGWFQYHEARTRERLDWSLALPDAEDQSVQYAEIHPQISGLLGYDYGHRFFYRLGSRAGCEVYFYGYEPDNKLASVSSYGHSPAICMESIGATILRQFEDLQVENGELELNLDHYLFELSDGKSRLHVFWVVWENRNMNIDPEDLASLDYRTQWIQLSKGRRDFSRKVLLISLNGIEKAENARSRVRGLLTDWVIPETD